MARREVWIVLLGLARRPRAHQTLMLGACPLRHASPEGILAVRGSRAVGRLEERGAHRRAKRAAGAGAVRAVLLGRVSANAAAGMTSATSATATVILDFMLFLLPWWGSRLTRAGWM